MDTAYTHTYRHTRRRTAPRHATPRHATPCHAVRIIKRNYCRAVVNNALLLKRVPASASIVSENRSDARAGLRCVLSRYVRFPLVTLTWRCSPLTWRSGRVRISCLKLATSPATVESRDHILQKSQQNSFGMFGACDACM